MNLLVIDLDGTITKSDNLVGFSLFMIVKKRKIRFLLFFPLITLLKLKIIDNVKFKIWYSKSIIRSLNVDYLKECTNAFVNSDSFQRSLIDDVIKFIDEQKDTDKLILSANYTFIAECVAKLINIDKCIAVNIETLDGKYTGLITGQIPYGKRKVELFSNSFNSSKYKKTIGIGDSKSDIPILEFLDEGYLITYNKQLNKTTFTKV
jgi:HAD superfamily phosphoserine phosphatase-like hydrolase